MLPCHGCYFDVTWRSKEVGKVKIIVWWEVEGEGGTDREDGGGGDFMEVLTPKLVSPNYLPSSVSFGVNRIL